MTPSPSNPLNGVPSQGRPYSGPDERESRKRYRGLTERGRRSQQGRTLDGRTRWVCGRETGSTECPDPFRERGWVDASTSTCGRGRYIWGTWYHPEVPVGNRPGLEGPRTPSPPTLPHTAPVVPLQSESMVLHLIGATEPPNHSVT